MFLHRDRIAHGLSAFDRARNRWTAISLRDPKDPVTRRPPSSHILKGPKFPDIIFLQEVASSARESVLSHPGVRSSFLATDAEDDMAFTGVPFATMTLLSSRRFGYTLLAEEEGKGEGEGKSKSKGSPKLMLDSVFRTELPSRYDRDALCVNIAAPAAPGTVLRLLNVHLDSLDAQFRRTLQMDILAGFLREPGCSGGVIAGDFNAIHPNDYTLVDENKLVDA